MTGLVLDRMETGTSMNEDGGPIIISTWLAGSGLQSTVHFVYLNCTGVENMRQEKVSNSRWSDADTGSKRMTKIGGEARSG